MYSLRHDTSCASPITKPYIYSIFLKILKMYMALPLLQLIVSNGKAATDSVHMFLHPRFLSRSLSEWYRKWYWIAPGQIFKTPVWYKKKRFKPTSAYLAHIKTNKFESIDIPHFIEHVQSLRIILLIPSIWFIDVQFSNS